MVLFYKANGKREIPIPKEDSPSDSAATNQESESEQQTKQASSGKGDKSGEQVVTMSSLLSTMVSQPPQAVPQGKRTTEIGSSNGTSVPTTTSASEVASTKSSGDIIEMTT
jgi:hypothetical protein